MGSEAAFIFHCEGEEDVGPSMDRCDGLRGDAAYLNVRLFACLAA